MGIIIATLIVVVAIASVFAQNLAIFSWDYWLEGGNALRSEVVRNLGLLAAAVIGLAVGSWRAVTGYMQARASLRQATAAGEQADVANVQARIAEQGQITERFSGAVEQLGHDRVTVRIGGLYALWRLAEDSVERDYLAVMDVLTNFIRQPPYADAQREAAERDEALRVFRTNSAKENAEADQNDRADQTAGAAEPPPELELIDCPDIVAAIEIIQGRIEAQRAVEDKRAYRLSLSRAGLSYLRLPEVDLQNFDLSGADLSGADLTGADLRGTDLTNADLPGAYLRDADLTGAKLWQADLGHADLSEAILTGANLTGAELKGANLSDAELKGANLSDADLSEAILTRANLTHADLTGADLTGADLTGADLKDAKPPGRQAPERRAQEY